MRVQRGCTVDLFTSNSSGVCCILLIDICEVVLVSWRLSSNLKCLLVLNTEKPHSWQVLEPSSLQKWGRRIFLNCVRNAWEICSGITTSTQSSVRGSFDPILYPLSFCQYLQSRLFVFLPSFLWQTLICLFITLLL